MKRIYEAEHITQAHLLRALLEQEGIEARVEGEYLQGGLGEIGVAGLIGISVANHQVEAARRIIDDFEGGRFRVVELPAEPPETGGVSSTGADSATRDTTWSPLVQAVVGALAVFLLYQLALLIWAR